MQRIKSLSWNKIILRALILVIGAFFLTIFLEWRFYGNEYERVRSFMIDADKVFYYNVFLMFLIVLFISMLFKKAWTGLGITFVIMIFISYINASKYAFRGQPLLPEDFNLLDQTGTLTKFIDIWSLLRTVLAVIIAIALTVFLNKVTSKFLDFKEQEPGKSFMDRKHRWARVTFMALSVLGMMSSFVLVRNHVGGRVSYVENLDTSFVAWNQMINYEENGFLLGFIYNLSKMEMQEPSGYSEAKVTEIKNSLEIDETKKTLKDQDYNVVIILNESFYDPSIIADYYPYSLNTSDKTNSSGVPVTSDVIPTIHSLMKDDKNNKRIATGQMFTVDYGGGTANVEFEVDTSMTNYWADTTPYVNLIPHINSVPSIASLAKAAGYDTVATHPFNQAMYKRHIVLKKEGFDEFIAEGDFSFDEKDDNRQYVNDRASYKEVLKLLNEHENKTLVSLITMQNHAGYGVDGFKKLSYKLADKPKKGTDLSEFSEDEKSQVEVYLESLHNSDYYLSEFLAELEKLDEKTVVLFYGDHSPGVYYRVNSSTDKNVRDLSYVTPYFVWANFDMKEPEEQKIDRYVVKNTTLPTTTPNCLVNTMFGLLDLRKEDYLKLVEPVCKEMPILTQIYFAEETPFMSTTLSNYEIYTYDILSGKNYWQK